MSTPASPSGRWTVARDIVSFLGGWAIIVYEVLRPEARESVLLLAGAIVGVPGMAVGARSVAEALRSRSGTDGPPPSLPEDLLQQSPSSSSSGQ